MERIIERTLKSMGAVREGKDARCSDGAVS